MKLSTLIVASLMTLTSAAAFAEGGSERSKAFYKDFTFVQQQTHGTAEQTALADGKSVKKETADKSAAEQQPNT
ncbi:MULTISPECIES: hypothetical protein [unclassified Pseudomonas]|jgi:hypothetical protein|uniref:hypothetical protein n=1 Tax=unclassified Pseudomonas TaxID=196821 RepID=UPI0008BC0757|nr:MULTISPECIES: hypothetical protein [unclassified Pseudomonas]PMV18170.1 hypothetical protein C1X17_27230 [Pseudomonas sp. FW305-3-2-15-C-TSA2]PMV20386.1 hypothetical protein C1X22_27295 [Pseudomonas sp. DP16D-L5]PMV33601.1 hypothetical protein C1X21_28630 [Pseudomonas sp. FW305-3-2-15-A-LB2]PMV39132.1 hypothetical protein C1X16_28290 [Pseudomonas sp. FW305-3-2-15-C-R2A1]PMV43589.1 hypothetical protein C1X18_28115 [Pseudomonas sp. FW305-3-2-15-C-LB1]